MLRRHRGFIRMLLSLSVLGSVSGTAFAVSSELRSNDWFSACALSVGPESNLRSAFLMRNWQQRKLVSPLTEEADRSTQLQEHFDCVLKLLVRNTHSSLMQAVERLETHSGKTWSVGERAARYRQLSIKRRQNVRRLLEYRDRGRFPLNEQYAMATPIFVDCHGTACAVGYLMIRSGHSPDVAAISRYDNTVYVSDSDDIALGRWILQSGLTREEAALIQPTYVPPVEHKLADLLDGQSDVQGSLLYENFSFEVSGTGTFGGADRSGVETKTQLGTFRVPDYIRVGSHGFAEFASTEQDEQLTLIIAYDVTSLTDQLIDRVDLSVGSFLIGDTDLFGQNYAYQDGSITLTTSVRSGQAVLGTITGEAQDDARLLVTESLVFQPRQQIRVENTLALEGRARATAFVNGIHLVPNPLEDACDVNRDGVCDVLDLDELVAAVRDGVSDVRFDLNGDARVDSNDRSFWLDVKHVYPGDANLDGYFNSRDLVKVFQAGQYEDEFQGNSSWATGDWNFDGDFTSADLTRVFRFGRYEGVARPASLAVPEPSGAIGLRGLLIWAFSYVFMQFRSARRRPH